MAHRHGNIKIKKSVSGTIFDILNILFFAFFCLTVIFPVWDMVVRSFSSPSDISYTSINLWPKEFVTQAYEYCFNKPLFLTAYVNTILRAILGTLYHLFIVIIAAFVLTRTDMPGRKAITFVWLIPMFFSAGLIPTFVFYKEIGIYNNFLVYILPAAFSMYTIIIVRNFFMSIDRGLEEAAVVDGANPVKILLNVYLPLSKPALATVTLWHVVHQWNAWFDNMAYVSDERLTTLQFLLRRIRIEAELFSSDAALIGNEHSMASIINSDNILAATTVLIVIPIIMVYPFLQKYFVKGTMLGAVKG